MTFGKKIERYDSCGTCKGDLNLSVTNKLSID